MLLLTKSHHVRDVEFSGAAIATTVAEVETGNAIRAGCSDKGVQCDNLGVSGQLNTQDLASFVSVRSQLRISWHTWIFELDRITVQYTIIM